MAASSEGGRPALPGGPYQACLFDMDGVLTDTAAVHDRAWKQVFDAFLERWAKRHGGTQAPFDADTDYDDYVDGKPREDGVRSFLQSRGIQLDEGTPDDPPDAETIHGLGNRKNEALLQMIRKDGVEAFPGSVEFLRATRAAGLRTAVVSSSANCAEVVKAAGLESYFDARVDGNDLREHELAGKPAPDTFLEAARRLRVDASAAVVFEDALAGVEAGHEGGFGLVVGVNRQDQRQRQALADHGADVVVEDLGELVTLP